MSQIIDAANILVDAAIKRLKFDKTVAVEIIELVDESNGTYRVKYNGNEMTAYSSDVTLEEGETAYMKVPEGDFSNKKTLEGKTTGGANVSSGNATALPDQEFAMGNAIEVQNLGLKIYRDDEKTVAKAEKENGFTDVATSLQSYSSIYNKFRLSAQFETNIAKDLSNGSYSLNIEFSVDGNDSGTETITIDRSYMNANILFAQETTLNASGIFEIAPNIAITGINSVTLVGTGDFAAGSSSTKYSIQVKNFTIQFIETTNLTNIPYYVSIATTGINDSEEKITLTLKGSFYYYGKLQEKNVEYHWFKQDYSVDINSADYSTLAGYGWKEVLAEQTIDINKLTYDIDYKLVTIFDNDIIADAVVNIAGTSPALFELVQDGINLSVVKAEDGEPLEESAGYTYRWWYYRKGEYAPLTNTTSTINIEQFLILSNVVFYCEVSKDAVVIALLSTTQARVVDTGVSATFSGIDVYNYSADGDMPIEQAEQRRFLKVAVDWGTADEPAYYVKWYAPDGKELNSVDYTPEKSMLRDLHVSNGVVWYSIRSTYSDEYNRNTITAKVFTADEGHIFKKDILFTKTGDPGTNGTAYQAVIRYCDAEGNDLNTYCGLDYSSGSASTIYAKMHVYKNSEELVLDEDWDINWELNNQNVTVKAEDDKVSITSSAGKEATKYISAMVENSTLGVTLYPKLAIDSYTGIDVSKLKITNAPNWVQYSSNGLRPQYTRAPFDVSYDGETVSYEGDDISTSNNETRLNPPDSMDTLLNGNTYDMIQYIIEIGSSGKIYRTVLVYKNVYGNEVINGWDGISLSWTQNEKSSTILATQIGAGTKDPENNRFTGVVMGKVTDASIGDNVYGIYGYKDGVNTFYINKDGDCYLKGKIEATSGTFSGTITAGAGSKIGGWSIGDTYLKGGNLQFNADGSISFSNSNSGYYDWSIDKYGKASFKYIKAQGGSLGAWEIDQYGLRSGTQQITPYTFQITNGIITNATIAAPNFTLPYDGGGWTIAQYSNGTLRQYGTFAGWASAAALGVDGAIPMFNLSIGN